MDYIAYNSCELIHFVGHLVHIDAISVGVCLPIAIPTGVKQFSVLFVLLWIEHIVTLGAKFNTNIGWPAIRCNFVLFVGNLTIVVHWIVPEHHIILLVLLVSLELHHGGSGEWSRDGRIGIIKLLMIREKNGRYVWERLKANGTSLAAHVSRPTHTRALCKKLVRSRKTYIMAASGFNKRPLEIPFYLPEAFGIRRRVGPPAVGQPGAQNGPARPWPRLDSATDHLFE